MPKRTVCLIGAPHDANSSFMHGAAAGPDKIRATMHNGAANLTSEAGLDVSDATVLLDAGNMQLEADYAGVMGVESALQAVLGDGQKPLMLGGDHAVSYPALRAVYAQHGPVDILHFDAHSDTYPNFDDNRYSHASPFARILEEGLCGRLVQIGVRTLTAEQSDVIARYNVECTPWQGDIKPWLGLQFGRPVYISIDIDALDPAFAPGVSHHEPGGLSSRDVLQVLQSLNANVVAADIVEYNPSRDMNDMTAMVCVKFVKELATLLHQ